MGKGDRKTAKGKRYNSSYGNSRPQAKKTVAATATVKKAATKAVKKTVTKKVAAKD